MGCFSSKSSTSSEQSYVCRTASQTTRAAEGNTIPPAVPVPTPAPAPATAPAPTEGNANNIRVTFVTPNFTQRAIQWQEAQAHEIYAAQDQDQHAVERQRAFSLACLEGRIPEAADSGR